MEVIRIPQHRLEAIGAAAEAECPDSHYVIVVVSPRLGRGDNGIFQIIGPSVPWPQLCEDFRLLGILERRGLLNPIRPIQEGPI